MFNKVIICLLSSFLMCCHAIASDKVKIATSNFAPFEWKDGNDLKGADIETVTEVLKQAGYEPVIDLMPWNRAVSLVDSGEYIGLMSLTSSKEREAKFYMSDPISYTQNYFFKKSDSKIQANSLSELANYNIGTCEGYNYGTEFDAVKFSKLSAMSSDTPELLNLKKLNGSRIDLTICEVNVCNFLINQNKAELSSLQAIDSLPVGTARGFSVAFSKKDPKAKEIVDKFNIELKKFIASGKQDEIFKKYQFKNVKAK